MKNPVADIMTVALARMLKNDETVIHGIASPLPMVAIHLAKALHAPEMIYINIAGGINAHPTELPISGAGPEMVTGTKAYFGSQEIFDLSMRGRLDVAFLSGVQFDGEGNINASVIGDFHKPKVRLPGGAGSAVLLPMVKRAIIWCTKHNRRTFVEKCDFVTARGNIDKIVTPLCIFRCQGGRLMLESIHPFSSLEEVQTNTSFSILYDEIHFTPEPSQEELTMLNQVDPHNIRTVEFK